MIIALRRSLRRSSIACALLASAACSGPVVPAQDASSDAPSSREDAPSRDESSPIDVVIEDRAAPVDAGVEQDASVADSAARDASNGDSASDAAIRLRDRYPLNARFPEGGTFDPSQSAFYVGSLGDGSVRRVDGASGAETTIFTETAAGRWWTLGMDIDVARNRLWVCAMDDRSPSPRQGHVWVFDTTTHRRVANVALSAAAADATCTDVAVARDGNAYVCDREQGRIYRLSMGAAPTVFVRNDLLSGSFVGQNGITVLPDQTGLLSVVYGAPALVHIDLRDLSIRRVTINGRFSDLRPLAGADGIAFANGSAYVAFTSKLIRVTPTLADWSRADSTNVDLPDGMTDVIATPDGLYMLNGQAVRFAIGTATDPFALVRFVGTL